MRKTSILVSGAAIFASAVFLLLILSPLRSYMHADTDTLFHIRAGEVLVHNRGIPDVDPITFAPVHRWTAQAWLYEVVLFLLYRTGGANGILILQAFLVAVTTWLLLESTSGYAKRFSPGDGMIFLATFLGVLLAMRTWTIRPHTPAFLFLIIVNTIITRYRSNGCDKEWLWAIPAVMLVWVNMHASFIVGILLLGFALFAYSIEERRCLFKKDGRSRILIRVFAVTILAALCNPYTYEAFLFPFRIVGAKAYLFPNSEYLPPPFGDFHLFLILLSIGAVVSMKSFGWFEILTVGSFGYMGLVSLRFTPLLAAVGLPIAARAFGTRFGGCELDCSKNHPRSWAMDTMIMGVIATAGSIYMLEASPAKYLTNPIPWKIVRGLDEHAQEARGRVFNDHALGSVLYFYSSTGMKVFVDSRLDVYGPERWMEAMGILDGKPGWEIQLEKFGLTWVAVLKESGIAKDILRNPGRWELVAEEKNAVLYRKGTPVSQMTGKSWFHSPASVGLSQKTEYRSGEKPPGHESLDHRGKG